MTIPPSDRPAHRPAELPEQRSAISHQPSVSTQRSSSLVATASRRFLASHPVLLVLAVLGIALGVAAVTGIDVANASARSAFAASVAGVTGRATHQITAGGEGLPDGLFADLRRNGVVAAPVIEADVALVGRPGSAAGAPAVLRLMGVDPLAEARFRPDLALVRRDGGAPLAAFMGEPGAVILGSHTAAGLGLASGDRFTMRSGTREHGLQVVGLIDARDDLARRGLDRLAIVDISTAQEVLHRLGRVDRIDLILDDESAHAAVRRLLPPGSELLPSSARGEALAQMTAAFHLNLTALSLLAMVVGMFLIFNTVTFSVVRRRDLIGRLRALGVTRREVFAMILAEAAVLGALGTLIGLAAGMWLAGDLVRMVARTINDLYVAVAVRDLAVAPSLIIGNAALGLGATLLAALAPAWEAASAPPRLALVRSGIESGARRLVPWLAAAGVAVLAIVALLLSAGGLVAGFAAMAGLIGGVALLTPALLIAIVAAMRPVLRLAFGTIGGMCARGVVATLSRTGVATAALVVAAAASLGVGLMVGSFRSTVATWLDSTLQADWYVTAPNLIQARVGDQPLDAALVDRLARIQGIARMVVKSDVPALTDRGPAQITTFAANADPRGFIFTGGERTAAWSAFIAGSALVSEPFAYRRGLETGDTIVLRSPGGDRPVAVAGVVADYSSDQGRIYLARSAYEAWFRRRRSPPLPSMPPRGWTCGRWNRSCAPPRAIRPWPSPPTASCAGRPWRSSIAPSPSPASSASSPGRWPSSACSAR